MLDTHTLEFIKTQREMCTMLLWAEEVQPYVERLILLARTHKELLATYYAHGETPLMGICQFLEETLQAEGGKHEKRSEVDQSNHDGI